jgi:hypothetical protein
LKAPHSKFVGSRFDPFRSVLTSVGDSLEKAEVFFKSKEWADLAPDRDKALKTIRRYLVEAVN